MEQLVLKYFKLLPEPQQQEVLHYIQYLLTKAYRSNQPAPKMKKVKKLSFSDFHFQERGQTYSRSEIYGEDGR